MMEIYKTPSKETQEILLASAIYAEVIEGLNGYFASEPRNDYITICRQIDSRTFYLYDPEKWADILISWLRTEHDIFYYPGMEAKYAKMERIPPFTERMMDEGAYNSLIALHKRVTGKETSTNSYTLIADNIKYFVNEEESDIKKLKDRIAELESNCKDIMNYIRQESSRNGFELPEEIDGEPLTIKRVFHDLLELLRKRGVEIKEVNDQRWKDLRDIYKALGCYDVYSNVDDFLKAVKARAEHIESLSRNAERETRKAVNDQLKKDTDYVADVLSTILEALGISKSNTVHLDIFGLKTKAIQRASVIKSEHGRYQEQLGKATADYQALSEENQKLKFKLNGSVGRQEYTIELRAKTRAEIENYKLKLKDYILKGIRKHGYRYDGLETKSVEEIVDRIIQIATCPRDEWAEDEIKNLRSQIDRLKGLINAMNEEVKDM